MSNNLIITIGRECGSGGKWIGQKIAEQLGIKCYDKELLIEEAKKSGLDEKFLEKYDEKNMDLFYSIFMGASAAVNFAGETPDPFKARTALVDTIKKLAAQESCVIIGRCADFILKDEPNLITIYVTGDHADNVARIKELYRMTDKEAEEYIKKTDKRREGFYNFYTDKKWGNVDSYDLVINSSRIGIEGSAALVCAFVEQRKAKLQA